MPKYIDADALKEKLKDIYCLSCNPFGEHRECKYCVAQDIINMLDDMPDAIVPCGECKWWIDNRCTNVNGAYNNTIFNPGWFCRSGVRKEQ